MANEADTPHKPVPVESLAPPPQEMESRGTACQTPPEVTSPHLMVLDHVSLPQFFSLLFHPRPVFREKAAEEVCRPASQSGIEELETDTRVVPELGQGVRESKDHLPDLRGGRERGSQDWVG